MTTQNLRREARVDVQVPVVLYRGKVTVSLETSDVSFKGLFVRTTEPPALRSLVKLRVAILERHLEAHAMAVHVVTTDDADDDPYGRVPGVGLQFWGLSGPDRAAWDDFVRGLVQARRTAAKKAAVIALSRGTADDAHPALSEPATPSGIHGAPPPSRASSK